MDDERPDRDRLMADLFIVVGCMLGALVIIILAVNEVFS